MNGIKSYISNIRQTIGKLGKSPDADWYFALSAFVIGIILVVAIDALLFVGFGSSDGSAAAADLSPVTLDRKDITDAIEALNKDDAESAIIPDIVKKDPSF